MMNKAQAQSWKPVPYQATDIPLADLKKKIKAYFNVKECEPCDLIRKLIPSQRKSAERLMIFLEDHQVKLASLDAKEAARALFCYDPSLYREIRFQFAAECREIHHSLFIMLLRFLPKEICDQPDCLNVLALPEMSEEKDLPDTLRNPPKQEQKADHKKRAFENGVCFDCTEVQPSESTVVQRAQDLALDHLLDEETYSDELKELGISEHDWDMVTVLTDDVLEHFKTTVFTSRMPGYGLHLIKSRWPQLYEWLDNLRDRCLSSDITRGEKLLWLWVDLYIGLACRNVEDDLLNRDVAVRRQNLNWKQIPSKAFSSYAPTSYVPNSYEPKSYESGSPAASLVVSIDMSSTSSSASSSTISLSSGSSTSLLSGTPESERKLPAYKPALKRKHADDLSGKELPTPKKRMEREAEIQHLSGVFGQPADMGKVKDYLDRVQANHTAAMKNLESMLQDRDVLVSRLRKKNKVLKETIRQLKSEKDGWH